MISVNEGVVPDLAIGKSLGRIPGGDGAAGDGQAQGGSVGEGACYRVLLDGGSDRPASQSRLWRRLFRVLEDPLKPIVLIDGGTISLFSVLQQVRQFADSPELRAECNYVVIVPGESETRDELTEAVHQAIQDGNLYGQCVDFVLDEYAAELPTMLWLTGRSGGVVLADRPSRTAPEGTPSDWRYRLEPIGTSEPITPARFSREFAALDRSAREGSARDRAALDAATTVSSPGFPADRIAASADGQG